MSKASTWLLEHRRDVYSQTGEDGIIATILETIPQNDKWCVEFGAWDGVYLSTTRHLIKSKGYSSVLIEPDKNKFCDLQRNYLQHDNVFTINRCVGFGSNDNLDRILRETPIPYNYDYLSIDVDGNDYHIWKAVIQYRPKAVAIEFNPTIPSNVRFVQAADRSINQGASLLSLVELGREKGYELVSVLPFTAFFVRNEYYPLFEIQSNAPEVLRTNVDAITYVFSGYDGTVFLRGCCQLPWHSIKLKESRIQFLPRYLRKYPANYTRIERIACLLYVYLHVCVSEPMRVVRAIHRLVKGLTARNF